MIKPLAGGVLVYLLAIPWSFVVAGMALRKRYRGVPDRAGGRRRLGDFEL